MSVGLIVYVVEVATNIYSWLIIIRILFSWIGVPDQDLLRQVHDFVYQVTEPYLSLFRGEFHK